MVSQFKTLSALNTMKSEIEKTKEFRNGQFFSKIKIIYEIIDSYGVEVSSSYLVSFRDFYQDEFLVEVLDSDGIIYNFTIDLTTKPIKVVMSSLHIDQQYEKTLPKYRESYASKFTIFNRENPNKIKNQKFLNSVNKKITFAQFKELGL